ncbi:MAG: hypothetical protein PHV68_09250, partial [Candidatus Gastranaerophilales bacterium]|nr:hypothetical protein [Candidatus Gastranaerophilales bacterium]
PIFSLLGSISEDQLVKLGDAIAKKDSDGILTLISEILQSGNEPSSVLRELISYFRNMMIIKTAQKIEDVINLLDVSEFIHNDLKAQSEHFEVIELAQIVEKLAEAEKILKTTTTQHLWLEVALISICFRQDIQLIKDLEQRVLNLEEKLASGNISAVPSQIKTVSSVVSKPILQQAAPKMEEIQQAKPLQEKNPEPTGSKKTTVVEEIKPLEPMVSGVNYLTGNLEANWKEVLKELNAIKTTIMCFFRDLSKPVEIDSEKIIITFANDTFVKQTQQDKEKMEALEKAVSNLFGKVPRIIIRTPMADDEKIRKNSSSTPILETKKNTIQSLANETIVKKQPETAVAKTTSVPIQISQEIILQESKEEAEPVKEKSSSNLSTVGLSDSTKQIVNIFQGKIIDS